VTNLMWYAGRAVAMSPQEMLWRLGRAGSSITERFGHSEPSDSKVLGSSMRDWDTLLQEFREGQARPVLLDIDRARRIAADNPSEATALVVEADRVVAGERTYFGYPRVDVGANVDWNYDAVADFHWPDMASSRINYRFAKGDPKWIWELNRLQHLPILAQAWLLTGESIYAETAFDHLDTWMEQNPFGSGIAWHGAFEAGLRAISVSIALQGLRTSRALTAKRYRQIVRMLDASARYCWRARSRFSSANNHLVGELVGVATVHLLLPELAAPATVFDDCLKSLCDEAERQILPDGAGAEQAISYQIFTVELFSIVIRLLQARGDEVPPQLTAAVERSSRYLSALVGTDDPDPRYGDDDDGFVLRLGAEPKRTVRQHLGITAAITGANPRTSERTLTAAWFETALTSHPVKHPVDAGEAIETSIYARHGGLVVLRSGRRRLTMDVGPLGYLSIAAHGHADALAVTLSVEGRELIVDPGTASYYGRPQWRSAHRGTRTHPTVCVDGLDQSVIGGPFYWSRHAETTVHSVDLDQGVIDAEHDGYRRLSDPVVHRRWLIAPPADDTIAVVDLIDSRTAHDIAVSWPLAPDLEVIASRHGHRAARDGDTALEISYAASADLGVEQVKADAENQLGWWSDRLEARTPSWLVGARCRAVGPVAVLTLLRTVDAGAITEPAISMAGVRVTASWYEHGVERGLTIDRTLSGAVVDGPFSRAEEVLSNP